MSAAKIGDHEIPESIAKARDAGTRKELAGDFTPETVCGSDCQRAFRAFSSTDESEREWLRNSLGIENLPESARGVARLVAIWIFG